jgi:NAD(P)H-hydrate epimerase
MNRDSPFWTAEGQPGPAVTAAQMREVDRIAVEDFGLGILQMMENAGRSLAENALDMLGGTGSAERTLTLALPKMGLIVLSGELYLADIGIPSEVYRPLGLTFDNFFGGRYWLRLLSGRP